jgi:hypothetical protein
MGVVLIIGACLSLAIILLDSLPDAVKRIGLLAVLVQPPLGMAIALWRVPPASRARADVRVLGYDVPWERVQTCSEPADVKGRKGIWIGGGERWPSDSEPDTIILPGFRSHLIEICREEELVKARVVSPGTQFASSQAWQFGTNPRPYFSLVASDGLYFQMVTLNGGATATTIPLERSDCLSVPGGPSIKASDAIEYVVQQANDEAKAQATKARTWLLSQIERRPAPERNYVFCLDLARGLKRCDPGTTDLREMMFLWRSAGVRPIAAGEKWQAVLPAGASRTCSSGGPAIPEEVPVNVERFGNKTAFTERFIEKLPAVRIRMVARRTRGGAADVTVPLENDRFSPAAFRLGAEHILHFARQDDRLLIFAPEQSVQIRYDDLFGPAPYLASPEGEFTLVFGDHPGDDLLVADLAAATDGLQPKLAFGNLPVRVRIPDLYSTRFSATLPGMRPEWHSIGAIVSVSSAPAVTDHPQPSVLISVNRITAPAGLWLVSLISALLVLAAWIWSAAAEPWHYARWTTIGLLSLVLNMRMLLAAREVMATPRGAAYGDFLLAACFLLVGPLVLAIPWGTLRRTGVQWSGARPRPRRLALFILLEAGLCAAGLAAAVGSIDMPTVFGLTASVLGGLGKTALATGLGVFAGSVAYGWTARRARTSATGGGAAFAGPQPGQFGKGVRIAIAAGALYLGARLVLMFLGYQESLPLGLKLDVLFLPIAAGIFSAVTGSASTRSYPTITSVLIVYALAFIATGFAVNDLGLWWVGGMAVVLALPFVARRQVQAMAVAAIVLGIFFFGPKLIPSEAVHLLRYLPAGSNLEVNGSKVTVPDPLQANRQRDHYRMLDAIAPENLDDIPSQVAREVTIEHERLRYQALGGAWREGFRERTNRAGPWFGAGPMQARPIFGEPTFQQAAKSDYVYLLYLRAEYGTFGVLGLALAYAALFVAAAHEGSPASKRPLGLWALALGVGCGLFMLGGTHGLFPFSGKWSLFLAIASPSDVSLGMALLILSGREIP